MKYQQYFENAKKGSAILNQINKETINEILRDIADDLLSKADDILMANQYDLEKMPVTDPKYDRLKLDKTRLEAMAREVLNVVDLESPLAEIISSSKLPNGLDISKIRVPLGVVGVVYEARPNVTLDVFALCFKTGNVVILKGGSDAEASNKAIMSVIQDVLHRHGIEESVAVLLPADREATAALLQAVGYVDVLIPRGSQSLINYVREHSKV
ncbi:MAG: aldehyde dehydrogenase family protein, partial [Pedobacter sp.]|nr:aldehyde dehydrogenase family protein [Pedobacter sp.]